MVGSSGGSEWRGSGGWYFVDGGGHEWQWFVVDHNIIPLQTLLPNTRVEMGFFLL